MFKNYLLLAILLALFQLFWWGFTRGSNVAVSGAFYTEGYHAKYELAGTTAKIFGSDRLTLKVVESSEKTATVKITAGKNSRQFVVDRKSAKIIIGRKERRSPHFLLRCRKRTGSDFCHIREKQKA